MMRTFFSRRVPAALALLLSLPAYAQVQVKAPSDDDTCVSCHRQNGGELGAPIDLMQDDVHGALGFSCTSCHGGDSEATDKKLSMDPRKGYIGKPSPSQVSAICGTCHVEEPTLYAASVHGQLAARRDLKTATCVSCHGAHRIFKANDSRSSVHPTRVSETCGNCHSVAEYMKSYGIPVDQVENFRKSVHAEALFGRQDLSAPTCNDCHTNHSVASASSGKAATACAGCHVRHAELFEDSPHKDGFDALGLPSCVTCHSNHEVLRPTDSDVSVNEGSKCLTCHDMGEPGYNAALAMYRTLTMLDRNIRESSLLLDRAARMGMEVSSPRFELSQARDSLLNSRVMVHGFSAPKVGETAGPGLALADKAYASGIAALEELQYRRMGLGVALLVIGLATVAVYLKIRDIESSSETEEQ